MHELVGRDPALAGHLLGDRPADAEQHCRAATAEGLAVDGRAVGGHDEDERPRGGEVAEVGGEGFRGRAHPSGQRVVVHRAVGRRDADGDRLPRHRRRSRVPRAEGGVRRVREPLVDRFVGRVGSVLCRRRSREKGARADPVEPHRERGAVACVECPRRRRLPRALRRTPRRCPCRRGAVAASPRRNRYRTVHPAGHEGLAPAGRHVAPSHISTSRTNVCVRSSTSRGAAFGESVACTRSSRPSADASSS